MKTREKWNSGQKRGGWVVGGMGLMSADALARAHQRTREKEEKSVEGKEARRLFLNQNQTLRRRDGVEARRGGSACVRVCVCQ